MIAGVTEKFTSVKLDTVIPPLIHIVQYVTPGIEGKQDDICFLPVLALFTSTKVKFCTGSFH